MAKKSKKTGAPYWRSDHHYSVWLFKNDETPYNTLEFKF
jgi:hypothetical protein